MVDYGDSLLVGERKRTRLGESWKVDKAEYEGRWKRVNGGRAVLLGR